MPWFRYVATDDEGNRISGELQADSAESVAENLEISGLFPVTIEAIEAESAALKEPGRGRGRGGVWLSSSDLDQVTAKVADLTRAGLPLATGLRALSEEVPSWRLRRVLRILSDRLSAGESLDQVLAERPGNIPSHFVGLVRAGIATNSLGETIEQYLRFARDVREIRRSVALSLSYPLILIFLVMLFFVVFLSLIVPQFESIYDDFQMELPTLTLLLIDLSHWMRDFWFWNLLAMHMLIGLAWFSFDLTGARGLRRRLIGVVPFFGPMFRFASLSQLCHLLSIMIRNRIRLPDALRMTGDGVRDANVQEGCRLLAHDVEEGGALSEAVSCRPHFPRTLANTFRWHAHGDAFADALHASGEIYASMARSQTVLIRVVCEPILIVLVGGFVVLSALALFWPLLQLLNDLS